MSKKLIYWENEQEKIRMNKRLRLWMSNVLMNETTYVSMNHPFISGIYKGVND
jgi:hypothetical protein